MPEVVRPDVVVTARRRPKPLDGVKPQDSLSTDFLAVYGARSIGDLIEKLRDERGGRPFSIIVNGRRLSSVADLMALPAEALQSIQLYSPTEGARFGFTGPEQLLNLQLKAHFRFFSLDMEGSGSTDGGAESVKDAGSGAVIDNDYRWNGNVSVRADAGLLASQRPRDPVGGDGLADGQSLVARSRRLDALFGASRPVGDGTLDMTMTAQMSRSLNRTSAAVSQTSDTNSLSISESYNRQILGLFGSVSAQVHAQQSRLRTAGSCAATDVACVQQAVDSNNVGGSLGMNLSGKLAKLPTGMVQLNLSARRFTELTGVRDRVGTLDRQTVYSGTSGSGGLTVPLVPANGALSKWLGSLEVTPSIDYSGADGLGAAWGRNIGLRWVPFDGLSIDGALGRSTSLPSNDDINAPATILVGRTAYDYRVGALVPVERIVGGAPLPPQTMRDTRISAVFSKMLGRKSLFAQVNYSSNAIDRPPFSIVDPSLFLERAFPERFVRDAAGTLIRIDTRPLSAERRSIESLSGSISVGGRLGGVPPKSDGALVWAISLNAQRRLRESLLLAPGLPAIDLLATPLAVSRGARGRNRWDATWRVTSMRYGGSISVVLNSGLRSSEIRRPACASIR